MKKYRVLFIDLDDTLIKTRTGKTFAQGIWDMELKLNVFDKIKEMEPEYVFIVSNQGGIGTFVTEEDFNRKIDYVESALKSYIKHPKLKMVESMYCPSNDKNDPYRKPNAGMINFFIESAKLYNNKCTKKDMLMVGDASGKEGNFSNSDLKTALNAGIDYLDINDFLTLNFI